MASEVRACALCGRAVAEWLDLPRFSAHVCLSCAGRLGRTLTENPTSLVAVWPTLAQSDDLDEPEPKVRLPDGRFVEMRERTAELKKDLTLDARVELIRAYGVIGLHREQLIEAGVVLAAAPPKPLSQAAATVLFEERFVAPEALALLRNILFPG